VIVSLVFSIVSDRLNGYGGVSFSTMTLCSILWMYSIMQFGIDLVLMDSNPVYFSSSIFPIYKFNSLTNKVEEHYGPTLSWISGFALAAVWTFLTAGSVNPEWFGVVLSIGIKLFILLSCVYFT
jgi:hypothetical protein